MKKINLHLILGLMLLMVSQPTWASSGPGNIPDGKVHHLKIKTMGNYMGNYGEIRGHVVNCSSQNVLEGLLLHVPGKSLAIRLGTEGEFLLHLVPAGTHNLVLERDEHAVASIQRVPVESGKTTDLGRIEVCLDLDGDGFNTMADLNDRDAAVFPGAKDVCDGKDNDGDGRVDEDCSKAKCPKGGTFCLNNWNNSNRLQKLSDSAANNDVAQLKNYPVFQIDEDHRRMIRVR